MIAVDYVERQRVAGLALSLVREHEPALEALLCIEWSERFTRRLGDASLVTQAMLDLYHSMTAAARRRVKLPTTEPMARVRFSAPLWGRAGREEQDETAAHEIAHLIVFYRYHRGDYGRRRPAAHGREWLRCMREMGYRGDRTHSVDRTGIARRNSRSRDAHCHACGKVYVCGPKRFAKVLAREARLLRDPSADLSGYYCACSSSTHNFLRSAPSDAR